MATTSGPADLRAELARFHRGDVGSPSAGPAARPLLPRGLLPAALSGASIPPTHWPLTIDVSDESDDFAAELGARDRTALAETISTIELDPWAPFRLADLCAVRRLRSAHAHFAGQARELAGAVNALLAADRAQRPEGDAAHLSRLGPLGGALMDPARLASVTAARKTGAALPMRRRERLARDRDLLSKFVDAPPAPLWIAADDQRLTAGPLRMLRADDPCAAAVEQFDRAARELTPVVAAARRARLETAGAFDEERHEPALERLDWRDMTPRELALVPTIFALVDPFDLRDRQLGSLSRLLVSGRPIAVVIPLDCAPADLDAVAPHFEPAMLGLGHRETFVHQCSVAAPLEMARGFARALAGSRPSLHVVDRPWFEVEGVAMDTVARLRLAARAAPLLRYEPEAGASWSRRMTLEGNPAPTSDWGDLGEGATVTFADAALLDPAWRSQFAVADPRGGPATTALEPLESWLDLAEDERGRTLPFVAAVDSEGTAVRLVVTLALARAAADRRSFWRSLQELAGVRSEAVDRAVAAAIEERTERAAAERADLERRHLEELVAARGAASADAVQRIVSTLLNPFEGRQAS